MRILIVSENISMKMGGESSLPFYYAKLLADRGAEIWVTCHARVEDEVRSSFPELKDRLRFVEDTWMQRLIHRCGEVLSYRVRDLLVAQALHLSTQRRIRKVALQLCREGKIDVVLEPSPITPKGLSFMYGLGVPVVIGPMCGGMSFPPAFADNDSRLTRGLVAIGRLFSQIANQLVPGKLNADVLLVANRLTRNALPNGHRKKVIQIFESGVDLALWSATRSHRSCDEVRFIFSGRFVDWKGIKYLVLAFAKVFALYPQCRLDLIGGGELESDIKAIVGELKLTEAVRLHGWVSRTDAASLIHQCDVFVMPSLRECGGTAILEAMAIGKPVIATNWGGPKDYVNSTCGLLVDPSSKEGFIQGLADAMVQLAKSPEARRELGAGGQRRVREDCLDWSAKADRVFSILQETVSARAGR